MIIKNNTQEEFDKYLISYIKKTLFFSSKEFYKKFAENRDTEILILDAPLANENDINFVDIIADNSSDVVKEISNYSTDIRDYIENRELLKAMESLNDREAYILYKLFVEEKNGAEIAREFNVSKQYINKIKGRAFKKLRCCLEKEVK
ncbi:Sigma-70, region 4 [Caminicella sporogenes DSM 14501]|uniref:Sigma-70, region 4 n=1 Tax=Caminicella sporogenes DSM 14501 TaxID=1121266 RepID=A0A1M6RZ91_9FIRM|nr:sigma factor-like helix-turn-helix DNA-binding protein [Caminicella sporogenes]RKD27145.1 hypothetical protein BET04_09515 [Caminicella sporogenes]WIF95546.1 sigma factor-like helix-turn-helix DNA-binding protein [Caminicella sporogenes]SHK37771.1 Sigma-70, region 4 [Caminicella sporogenes DSM 14501]